jgi:undecaprenyl-diphosphatase
VWGALAALAAATTSNWRTKVAVWTGAALMAGVVGMSQLYLGAHWLTDVIGGWALGALWLVLLLTTVRTIGAARNPRTSRSPGHGPARRLLSEMLR